MDDTLTASPVRGLRPTRASRRLTEKAPKPRNSTRSPRDKAAGVELAVLDPDLERMEHGLETMVGARGVKLSGGQVQRSAAARMLATEAELLVFDDLSSALDLHTEAELWRRLFEKREATCLVVSHRKAALARFVSASHPFPRRGANLLRGTAGHC